MKKLVVSLALVLLLPGCAKVGSERWCNSIKEKSASDITASEAADYTKHCVLKKSED